jgi:hypothetical protein
MSSESGRIERANETIKFMSDLTGIMKVDKTARSLSQQTGPKHCGVFRL